MAIFEAECPICGLRYDGKSEEEVRQKVEKHSLEAHRRHAHEIEVVSFETKNPVKGLGRK
jgi:predicted small metal-binding protein